VAEEECAQSGEGAGGDDGVGIHLWVRGGADGADGGTADNAGGGADGGGGGGRVTERRDDGRRRTRERRETEATGLGGVTVARERARTTWRRWRAVAVGEEAEERRERGGEESDAEAASGARRPMRPAHDKSALKRLRGGRTRGGRSAREERA